ncbi:MAG: LysR family transcriptional regulator [Pollutimonas bauzanensis]|uniref:LysR family transcriptional regulator, nitrogen assimilation regulatory protein n=1 Tax=Pollutimonas bauzanensis TaxID=658167 RepID=A0A1M5ZU41_9BURK|nr:LysR substrate-binding domain-containing protein [Pollutimonas bauzanensis]SHI27626.1 LysR family transcriptional regulator, nitrogen assimilation regulatory protein [Pollutimonas bauzanensis]
MELRQLRFFIAVAESGAYSRAAMRLSMSQPLLSRQVKALEDELGVALFHRTGRGVTLTEAGAVLEQYARGLVETESSAVAAVRAVGRVPTGPAVIGMPASISSVLSVSLVQEFREAFPAVSLKVMEGYSGHVLEWLAAGRTDIAVLYDAPRLSIPALPMDALLTDELFLLGPMSDPAGVGRGPVRAERLGGIPLILPSRPHGIRVLVDEALAGIGAAPKVAMEIDAMHSMLRLVENGLGYAVLSYACVASQIAQERMRIWRVTDPVITRSLVIAASTQRPSTKPVRALGMMLRRQLLRLVEQGHWAPDPAVFS